MPLTFKTRTEKLTAALSLGAIGVSLVGFGLSLRVVGSIHPQKPVEISCGPDMVAGLERSASRLDRVRLEVLENKTIK